METIPETSVSLSAQHLRAEVVHRDGVPVLVLHDEEICVEISGEIGPAQAAAQGLERLEVGAAEYARVMWERAASGSL